MGAGSGKELENRFQFAKAVITLLTNLLEFGATTIAAIHKERWKSELFFKALKQNLTVKTFVGTSENATRLSYLGQH